MVAIGAAVGGLTGAALLIRKLRSHGEDEHDDDEGYDDEEEDEDEPRAQYDEDDDDDESYDDDEEDDDEPQARADDEDDEDDEYEDDEEDEDDEPQSRGSSDSEHAGGNGDRGLASTLWDAVVEGVRSSSSGKREKASRTRSRDADEEDDDSDRKPRGATKSERSRPATRAPRGNSNRQADDGGAAMDLVRRAKHHLVELTGHEAESVSGIERNGEGRAQIRLEVLELERIPRTTDVLATYELTLDESGQLVDCTRVARYTRSSSEAGVA